MRNFLINALLAASLLTMVVWMVGEVLTAFGL